MDGRRGHFQHSEPLSAWRGAVTGPAGAIVLAVVAVAALVAALFGPDSSLSLLDGAFPDVVLGLAAAGLAAAVLGRPGRWWMTWGVGIAASSAVDVAFASWWIHHTGLVDQHYPPSFLIWVWGGLVAVGLALTGWWSGTALRRVVCVVTAPIALFGSFLLINAHYGYWPTMGALLDRPIAGQVSGRDLAQALRGRLPAGEVGTFGQVSIPGPPGFDAGSAWVWIPPDYNRVAHADLAVLVMLPGVPGGPKNWEVAGEAVPLAAAWAASHNGLAPVMVFVSGNGAADRDTECVNGTQGPAETFLAQSVPDFITHTLGITPDPDRWGAVGFSEGGTCAIGLALEHPDIYGRFVDISGEMEPTFGAGTPASTLTDLYAGNVTEMLHHDPLWLLANHRYPHTVGWLSGSAADHHDEKIAAMLTGAARAAGAKAYDVSGGPGGHSWTYARLTLDHVYPALVESMAASAKPTGRHGHASVFVAESRRLPKGHGPSA